MKLSYYQAFNFLTILVMSSPIPKESDPDWVPSEDYMDLDNDDTIAYRVSIDKSKDNGADVVNNDTGVTDSSLGLNATEWFDKYGYPGPILYERLIHRDAYTVAPNYFTRNPYWTVEHIDAESIKPAKGVSRDESEFQEDDNIPVQFRSKLSDYKGSGYDRGHQSPAGDVQYSQAALNQTFYLSNMCPQVGEGFNRNYWAWTEEFPRNITGTYDSVRILTGPLYLPSAVTESEEPPRKKAYTKTYSSNSSKPTSEMTYKILNNNVHVPTHFFKVVIGENKTTSNTTVDAAAFVLPNEYIDNSVPLTNWKTSFDNLTTISGLEVLSNVKEGIKVNDLCEVVEGGCRIVVYSHDRYSN